MEFKIGDILVFRKDINPDLVLRNFTRGKSYKLKYIESYFITKYQYIFLNDDFGGEWTFSTNPIGKYYWSNYFYTKEELRDIKLINLGI